MDKALLSVGLDIGTTTTQMILSQLTIQNKASSFSVPEMQITERRILYESPIHFTPLLQGDLVDSEGIRAIVQAEYAHAGITRQDVDTGAVIITGETSRKENAAAVLQSLSDFAGDFVVATAGPHLESVLSAKGAGATAFSQSTGKTVVHMDIGGGTSNLSLIQDGRIVATGCLNVGGRLLKFDTNGRISYISPVLSSIFDEKIGDIPTSTQLNALSGILVSALEMAADLRERTDLLERLWTQEAGTPWPSVPSDCVISFSGGVADCIQTQHPDLTFGDIGPLLGKAIARSRLCQGAYRLGSQTIRATVIGAGSHATTLSGSTVFYQNIRFPLKNLPVIQQLSHLPRLDSAGVWAVPTPDDTHYDTISALADHIATHWPQQPIYLAMETDMAKALGHALSLRLPKDRQILCIDRVALTEGCYLDLNTPIGTAIPLVVKTLIMNR